MQALFSRSSDRWTGLLIAAVGIAFLIAIPTAVPNIRSSALITGRFFPAGVGALLVILGLALVLRPPTESKVPDQTGNVPRVRWAPFVAHAVIIAIYLVVMPWIGFELATLAVLTLLMKYQGVARWTVAAVIAAATMACFYLFFEVLLQVPLPAGALG